MSASIVQWLDRVPDLLTLSAFNPEAFPFLLESAARGPLGRHSILFFAEGPALVAHRGLGVVGPGAGESFFDRLDHWFRREEIPAAEAPSGLPFSGGWFVYLGYEMAAEIEPVLDLPAAPEGLPDAMAQRCPGAVIVAHGSGSGEPDRAAVVAETPAVLEQLLGRLAAVREDVASRGQDPVPDLECIVEEDPGQFKAAVLRIHDYLRAGDTFQVNVSRAWRGRFEAAPDIYRLYDSLRRANARVRVG